MATIPTVLSTDDIELVCLSLEGDGRVVWGNAAGRLLGRSQRPGANYLTDLAHPDDEMIVEDLLDEAKRQGRSERIIRVIDTERGSCYLHVKLSRHQPEPSAGKIPSQGPGDNLTVQGWDVTDLVLRQRGLKLHAFRDPLTAVPNRLAFMARLDQELAMSRPPRHDVAVIFADVDGFKAVNDVHGHGMGDRVLTELAGRLAACIRPGDLMSRIGGDEFAIICPDLSGWPAVADVMDRLRAAAAEPISTPTGPIKVTISLGAAFAEETRTQPDAAANLVARADQRMFHAKPAVRTDVPRSAEAITN